MQSPINRIVVDISCLADATFPILRLFSKNPQEITNRWPAGKQIWEALGIEKKKFVIELSRRGNGDFWSAIPPSRWYQELLATCKAAAPTIIVSDVSSHPGAAGGRTRWLQANFDLHFRDYLIGPRKHFLAGPGTLLIDTSDEGAQIFRDNGGEAIVFPCHWNSLHEYSANPMEYFSRQLQLAATPLFHGANNELVGIPAVIPVKTATPDQVAPLQAKVRKRSAKPVLA